MRILFYMLLMTVVYYDAAGQSSPSVGNCRIKGRVIDSLSRRVIDYAPVTAFADSSAAVAGGMITDNNGNFIIDNLKAGNYLLKVDYVGYATKTFPHILVTAKNCMVSAGDLAIASTARALGDVTIKGTRNLVENKLDKLVYNAEKDVSSQGGVATDVLKKVPMVAVDMDGNVDLMGDKNVRVFINGKPSAMFDNNLADALKSIPASMIKSVEVITSPGAQYDAQGTGGIINIILKDNKAHGVNGSAALSGGTRYENGSVTVHAKNGGLDLNASLSGNLQVPARTYSSLYRRGDSAGMLQNELIQNGYSSTIRDGYRASAGFDQAINKKDNLNGGVSYNNYGNTTDGSVPQQQIVTDLPAPDTMATTRDARSYYRYRGEDWNLNYRHKYSEDGHELTLSYQGNTGASSYNYQQNQHYTRTGALLGGARGNNGYRSMDNYLTADYTRPFGKEVVLTTGAKGSFSRMRSNADHGTLIDSVQQYYYDPAQYNVFNFDRDIYAVYASLSFPVNKHYSIRLGVRDEYTANRSPGDTVTIPSYNFITPSALISRSLNNNQTLKLGYARRLQRPGYGQYNPFTDATDPLNLLRGNPGIQPQKMHSLELSYFKFQENGSNISVSLFYRYAALDWQGYSTFYNVYETGGTVYNNVTVNTTINAGTEHSGGLNLWGTWAVNDKVQLRPNGSFFQKYTESPLLAAGSTSSFSYRGSLSATWQCNKNLVAEFYNGYNSARYEVQGKFPAYYSYSFSIRQQLFDKKASLGFSANNPFNQYTSQATYINASNFSSVATRHYPNQYFTLSFSFKFGKIEYTEKKEEHNEEAQPPTQS